VLVYNGGLILWGCSHIFTGSKSNSHALAGRDKSFFFTGQTHGTILSCICQVAEAAQERVTITLGASQHLWFCYTFDIFALLHYLVQLLHSWHYLSNKYYYFAEYCYFLCSFNWSVLFRVTWVGLICHKWTFWFCWASFYRPCCSSHWTNGCRAL